MASLKRDALDLDEFVIIARFNGLIEAQIAKSKLESEGIEAFIPDAYSVDLKLPFLPSGGIKLQVRAWQARRAMEILGINAS